MTTEPQPAAEEPSLPDEVWQQFANDSERAIRATAPKEPSARARIVARRLREEDQRAGQTAPPRWRRLRRQPRPYTPSQAAAAWRPDRPAPRPPLSPAIRRLRAVAGVALVVVVVLILLSPGRAWSWIH